MFLDLYSQHIKVFLAATTDDIASARNDMREILQKAGIEIVECTDKEDPTPRMQAADCSLHILGNEDIYTPQASGFNKPAGIQYQIAKTLCGQNFKMFIWNPSGIINTNNAYINNIRRDIIENTIYCDKLSPIVFVEDLRTIMNIKQKAAKQHEATDIFFMYNELDSETASGIFNMLKDFQKVTRLALSMASNVDYNTYIREQLTSSKIGVVYYNYAEDWAVSFARQVWKDTGGSSSNTPLLVAGNSEHANEKNLEIFKGIMECRIDDKLRIPLDIKVFLDKTNQNK